MIRGYLVVFILFGMLLYGDDYDFDMESIKTKTFEYAGYLRSQNRHQNLNQDSPSYILLEKTESSQNISFNEVMFGFTYYRDDFTLIGALSAKHNITAGDSENLFTAYQLYAHNRLSAYTAVDTGKKRLQWGTGYFTNPAAFLDRQKDPMQPENLYEGFVLIDYTYNKSFDGDLKNLKLDVVYMPTSSKINSDFDSQQTSNIAMKLYLLYLDTDINLIYLYNDKHNDKIGFMFAKNIASHFEIHGEYAKEIGGYHSYLLGLKYVTQSDITILSEYYYNSSGLDREEIATAVATKPYAAKSYLVSKISKKEPFDIVYSSIYFRDMFNLEDQSHVDTAGFIYTFKFDLELDLSYTINTGDIESEFGKKMVSNFVWLKATWYY
ncbi:MAG: hypothetical protein U9R27_06915 [Campylobacterota bacterium]|nr:hypothetical protein [Campylobacterota bacterium]